MACQAVQGLLFSLLSAIAGNRKKLNPLPGSGVSWDF